MNTPELDERPLCSRVWRIFGRRHHWHYDGIEEVPIKGCEDGATRKRSFYSCCHCPARRDGNPYD